MYTGDHLFVLQVHGDAMRDAGILNGDLALFPFVRRALNLAWRRRVRIRHLRLMLDRLIFPPAQMPLFEEECKTVVRQESIVAAMDKIRDRFGPRAVRVAHG